MSIKHNFWAVTATLCAFGGCAWAQQSAPITSPRGMQLVWHDEFDLDGMPGLAKWNPELGFVRNNGVAHQIYRLSNAR